MTTALWSITAYAVQLTALTAVALAATSLLRIRAPRAHLRFWQAVFVMALLVPLVQPRASSAPTLGALIQGTGLETIVRANVTPVTPGRADLDITTVIIVILSVGIVARLAWLLIGMLRLRTIVARATPAASLTSMTRELTTALNVRAEVRMTDDLAGPATVGARRPIVLLPPSVLGLSAAVQRAILCHELIHVQRRDWLNTIAEEIWCAVLWFHPVARVIASRVSLAREMVVDEATLRTTCDRRSYAEALLAFSNPQPHMIGVTPLIGRRTLSQRISLIAQEGSMSRRHALSAAVVALTATVLMTAAAVDRFPMFVTLSAQSTVYRPGNGVSLPRVVHETKAEYTREAMQAGIQGSVYLDVVIDENGDVAGVEVNRSLDKEYGLDQAAMDAARQWKFKPGEKDGKPVAVQVEIEMRFRLK